MQVRPAELSHCVVHILLRYVVFDTPGQIEVFTWSASGTIITETLVSTPLMAEFLVGLVRCGLDRSYVI